MNAQRKLSTREKIAAAVSGAVVIIMIVYWVTQIVGVIEMLRMAYG